MFREKVEAFMRLFQAELISDLERADEGAKFQKDVWQHSEGGGISGIVEGGHVLEKGGVNFSAVQGKLSPQFLKMLEMPDPDFFATGVSVVMHPESPMVPITHMNVRYFEAGDGKAWFGGGIDLTPQFIVDLEQAQEFHKAMKAVCDKHHPSYYAEFKNWADDYFFNIHRDETRGVGGIFFDRLMATEEFTMEQRFAFVKDVARAFAPFYTAIIKANRDLPYTDEEKQWQLIRRGRYVEFDLVYDRGTKFGLATGGRTESILMSLPLHASWIYNHKPKQDSAEAETLQYLKRGIDWINVL